MTDHGTGLFEKKIRKGIQSYVRVTAILILPVFYFVILFFLASRARETAAIQINTLFAQKLSLRVILLFSIYPIAWLCASAKRFCLFHRIPLFTRVIYIIFFGGIVSAHIVTWMAVHAGQYSFFTLECLIRYDLMLLDFYVYWKSDRKGMETGIKCLSVILWLSAIYGITECFLPDKFVLFRAFEGRAKSVYTNPIISGSAWLMGFWLPFPGKKRWISGLVKSCYAAAIFFTISKDAWIGLGVSIVLYLILNRKELIKKWDRRQKKYILLYIGLLLVLLIGFLCINHEYKELILVRWTNVQTDISFLNRLYHVQDTMRYMVHDAPVARVIFGYGNSLSREFIKSTPHFTGITNLDNQYIISLYEFGLVGLLCLILWAAVCCRAAIKGDSWQKAAGMGITAMLIPIGTYDPFQWEIITFLLLLLSVIAMTGTLITKPAKAAVRKAARVTGCVLAVGIVAIMVWPYLISWCRTLYYSLLDLYAGKPRFLVMVWYAVGIVSVCAAVCLLLYSFLAFCLPGKKRFVVIGVLSAIFVTWIGWGNRIIATEEKKLEPLIAEERELLQLIMSQAEGHVYEDRYPGIYQKYEKKIRASVFTGESIIPGDATTILTGGSECLTSLLEKGFLFSYLSEDHVLYTDDVHLIRALEAYGSHMTSYYHSYKSLENLSDPESVAEYDIHRFYNPAGRLVREENYTIEGEKTINVKGYFAKEWSYDMSGRLAAERHYGTDGQPSILPDGYSILEKEYDASGHTIWQRFYDGYHEPVLKGYEYSAIYDIYNAKGQIIREEYYGTDGELAELSGGYAATEREYDKEGNLTVQTYYDIENKPVRISSGYWKIVRTFNDKKQAVREEYFNVDGTAAWMPNGYYGQEMEYDEAGNISVIRFLDAGGNPMTRMQGYAEIHRSYNSQGQIILEEYYGIDGKPIVNTSGYAGTRREYDAAGNLTVQTFYDVEGKPLTTTAGYWKLEREYSFRRKVIRESYFDISENPVLTGAGYASFETDYDEAGNAVVVRYYDAGGNPVMRTDGFAELRRVYENRKVIQETYYNIDGEPVLISEGYAGITKEYDPFGNLTVQSFLGLEGEPVLCKTGYWKKVQHFDNRNLLIREEYYDLSGNLIENPSGFAATEMEYDEQGNRILWRYYNAAGEQTTREQGYALLHRIYSEDGNLLREEYADFEGNLVCFYAGYAAYEREYDEVRNMISESYYDPYGNPTVQRKGYWKVELEYNDRRQIVRETYLGVDGRLAASQDGYAIVERKYDEKGILVDQTCYDINEQPIS